MDSRVKFLKEQGDRQFELKRPVNALHQEIADNFYPEMATFTASRSWGFEFASHLTTSVPLLARQEMATSFSSLLRPRGKDWYHVRTDREEFEDRDAKLWLEDKEKVMRRAMYDRRAQFMRTTDEGDNNFAAFGGAPMSVDINPNTGNELLYQSYHLKDIAWRDGIEGQAEEFHRDWLNACARDLVKMFKGNVHPKVKEAAEKKPYTEFKCRHCVMPAEYYQSGTKWRQPFVSVWYDYDNDFVMEEVGRWDSFYLVPRWKRLPGSPYPFSPATMIALPDARTIQAQALTLLEAGEKAVDPPMLGRADLLRGDLGLFAGGITWADLEGDTKLEEALQTIGIDSKGIPFGMEMLKDTREMIKEAFFLNKLNLPATGPEMTAYEVGQRVQEYIRNALPLFGPMEDEYNGQLCERTFDLCLRAGAFGPPEEIPQSIRGANIRFVFESPLHDAMEMQNAQSFQDAMGPLQTAIALDPSSRHMLKVQVALRDVLDGRIPQKWIASEEEVQAGAQQDAQAAAAQTALAGAHAAGAAVEQVGKAGQAIKAAQQ